MLKKINTCKVGMALTAAAFLGLATSQPAAAITFSLTDLGTLGGDYSDANAINELGQVVGQSNTADGQRHAFFWDKSSGMTILGAQPSYFNNECYGYGYSYGNRNCPNFSTPIAINDLGQVIGYSYVYQYVGQGYYGYKPDLFLWDKSSGMTILSTGGSYYSSSSIIDINNLGQVIGNISNYYNPYDGPRPFLWEKNRNITFLTTPSNYYDYYGYTSSSASAINNLGQVVGSSSSYEGGYYSRYPFLWEKSSGMINLGTLGGTNGSASAINDLGQAIGTSSTADGQSRAFLWEKSSGMIDLGTLGGNSSNGSAINDLGQVIGQSYTVDGQSRAFLWEKSSGMIDLGTLGGNSSNGSAINNLGQVIGQSYTVDRQYRPFFWEKSSGMNDLNDLVSAPGWILNDVVGINNAGQIVGNGLYNGQTRAFLLTPDTSKPVPEPSSALGFLALGAVGAGALGKRK